jgi:hypothetical protein
MTCPSFAGVLNILAVSLNAAGVLTLFFFRGLPIGGVVSRNPDRPDSWQAAAKRNEARVWKQWVGVSGLVGAGRSAVLPLTAAC